MSHRHHEGEEDRYAGPDAADHVDMSEFLDSAVSEGKAYFTAQKNYLTLRAQEQIGRAAGNMFSGLLTAMSGLIFLLFTSIALAFWAGSRMGSTALGFLVVGGIYLMTFLIIRFVANGRIRRAFSLNVINSFYDDEE
ncbi:MAG: hypothetical protein IPO60_01940 [Flavobacteriales bacterium]|jgi:hypothetical protein|nr:hypothetical protein [Flavobacteriales bacterium]MBK6893783.1 hypothetical protein [Flavobacteriales bacterium]MBK7247737.1 hypothetical protein [Flavobacteriales bacterium]MBK7288317.1 hypothetical protein [Flavobacteriales bacterium]MBK9060428.1 hypothetical protein [Flavobacteriales bacterium]